MGWYQLISKIGQPARQWEQWGDVDAVVWSASRHDIGSSGAALAHQCDWHLSVGSVGLASAYQCNWHVGGISKRWNFAGILSSREHPSTSHAYLPLFPHTYRQLPVAGRCQDRVDMIITVKIECKNKIVANTLSHCSF